MEYTKLGTSDLTVSRICMGCMGFGDAQNGRHSRTIDRAHFEEIIKKGWSWGYTFLIPPLPTKAAPANNM